MAPSSKKQPSSQAQIDLVPNLKSCLVNLPANLVSVLSNANTIAQNVIVELIFRQTLAPSSDSEKPVTTPRSVYMGWTGMQSKRKLAPVVGKDGLVGSRSGAGRDQDIPIVEVDPVFARLLSLTEGQKIGVILHLDPPLANTINIEPLTPADWEMIELHASFLELNFLSQVRALPNPTYTDPESKFPPHPITLHLSPTSTANVIVTSVAPLPPKDSPFVKISPDSEIIVAPKERPRERSSRGENRSVASKKSTGGRSGASTVRKKSSRDHSHKNPLFMRGIDRSLDCDFFDEEDKITKDVGLRVWVDRDLLLSRPLKGVHWVSVSVIKPFGIMEKADAQKEAAETEKPATKVVARIGPWNDAPDSQHVALSSMLCQCLAAEGMVGGLVRVQAAPPQLDISALKAKESGQKLTLKIIPFLGSGSSVQTGLKFGGESKQEKESSAQKIRQIFSHKPDGDGLLDGPLSDGMILPARKDLGWHGGILRFDPGQTSEGEPTLSWILPPEKPLPIDFQPEIARPSIALRGWSPGEPLPEHAPTLVGVDDMVDQLTDRLRFSCSILLTGGLGSGKTSVAQLIAHRLREEELFYPIYFPCKTRTSGEYKVSIVKETIERLFAAAQWGARNGGRAVVILDDLDTACFAETELGEGGDNVRSRHVSECLCSIVQRCCSSESGVVLLATAQSKEALNSVIIGNHAVMEIFNITAPNKDLRRKVLESVVSKAYSNDKKPQSPVLSSPVKSIGSQPSTSHEALDGFSISPKLDFLDLAGQTDGYMPGDLVLFAARARSECLIRTVGDSTSDNSNLTLIPEDFAVALKGFTPASLRNVTLQTSTVRWSSIGGLKATRQILLETLQYPTTYAPIFANCPLRLRSGILLYGYPGCGKTLLASAVASECGLNFISVKGPEILNKYIGASEKSVRDLFERAQAARPCVLFFDEFDAIAPKRGHDSTGVTDRVVNQLLTQMDGAEGLEGVYVLAATSRPDLIDPALLRPGRLDKSVLCDMPGLEDRFDILKAVARSLKVDSEVEAKWAEVARRTDGMSGADIQALVYNAQLEAVHEALGAMPMTIGKNESTTSVNGVQSKRIPDFDVFTLSDAFAKETNLAAKAVMATKIRALIAQRRKQLAMLRPHPQERHQELSQESSPATSPLRNPPPRTFNPDPFINPNDESPVLPHQRNQVLANGRQKDEDDENSDDVDDGEGDTESEPIIHFRHIVSSLNSTRASISPDERRRLGRIYREFLSERSGDLPSGQAGTEIGGRTSLM